MTKTRLSRHLCAALQVSGFAIAAFTAVPAAAQPSDEWQFSFTPYIWATDLETTAGGSRTATTSKIDFDDLLFDQTAKDLLVGFSFRF